MNLFDNMLSRYTIVSENDLHNGTHEVMQEVTLAGLYRGGFFEKAAFYGGTCLRVFHKLNRFSEDLDFSLVAVSDDFNIEDYFPAIVAEFNAVGRDVEITPVKKRIFTGVESAFLKDTTLVYNVELSSSKRIKIKIEVDVNPPLNFATEQRLLLHPFSFMTRCFTLPDLYAGKMHALVFRKWKNRVKGRDWYDFEWYVRAGVELNFTHLQERIRQFNGIEMSQVEFIAELKERLSSTDIKMVKQDVYPFLKDAKELDIWSNEYFMQLADMIRFSY